MVHRPRSRPPGRPPRPSPPSACERWGLPGSGSHWRAHWSRPSPLSEPQRGDDRLGSESGSEHGQGDRRGTGGSSRDTQAHRAAGRARSHGARDRPRRQGPAAGEGLGRQRSAADAGRLGQPPPRGHPRTQGPVPRREGEHRPARRPWASTSRSATAADSGGPSAPTTSGRFEPAVFGGDGHALSREEVAKDHSPYSVRAARGGWWMAALPGVQKAVRTDAEGRFATTFPLSPGLGVKLHFASADYTLQAIRNLKPEDLDRPLEVTLEPTRLVRARVIEVPEDDPKAYLNWSAYTVDPAGKIQAEWQSWMLPNPNGPRSRSHEAAPRGPATGRPIQDRVPLRDRPAAHRHRCFSRRRSARPARFHAHAGPASGWSASRPPRSRRPTSRASR